MCGLDGYVLYLEWAEWMGGWKSRELCGLLFLRCYFECDICIWESLAEKDDGLEGFSLVVVVVSVYVGRLVGRSVGRSVGMQYTSDIRQ